MNELKGGVFLNWVDVVKAFLFTMEKASCYHPTMLSCMGVQNGLGFAVELPVSLAFTPHRIPFGGQQQLPNAKV